MADRTAMEVASLIPDDVRRALTLAGMIETAGPGECHAATKLEADEFIQLLASGLVHLAHYTLELSGAVKDENAP